MDYRIEAFDILLNEDCLLQRYHPLIPYKTVLIESLKKCGCNTKNECAALSDECLAEAGLPDAGLVALFRRFLVMYDVKPGKFREIANSAAGGADEEALRELFLLPGVRSVRALLYCESGYGSLERIAHAAPDDLIRDTSELIERKGLAVTAPLPKEARTHIAVARAFTEFAV